MGDYVALELTGTAEREKPAYGAQCSFCGWAAENGFLGMLGLLACAAVVNGLKDKISEKVGAGAARACNAARAWCRCRRPGKALRHEVFPAASRAPPASDAGAAAAAAAAVTTALAPAPRNRSSSLTPQTQSVEAGLQLLGFSPEVSRLGLDLRSRRLGA